MRVLAPIVALLALSTAAHAQCGGLDGLVAATDRDYEQIRLAIAQHDTGALCRAGLDAYASQRAVVAYLGANPSCVSRERRATEINVLKSVASHLNTVCHAGLPAVFDAAD